MFEVVILPVQIGRGLFCSSIFIFFYIDDKEKINLITRSSHSNLQLFLKIYKYYNKTNPTGISPNIYFIYKKLLQEFLKSICLVKELFLVNPFIGVFSGLLRQVSQHLPRKISLIFGILETAEILHIIFRLQVQFQKPKQMCIKKW